MTDRYTDELFDTTTRLGGSMLVNQASRLVMDPERFPDDDDEPMSKKGMGVVYTHTSDGRKLRDENFDSQQREELMIRLFYPYRDAIETLVTDSLKRFSKCLIIDAHSFPSKPLLYEDPDLQRPDICFGYDEYHAPNELLNELKEVCADQGYKTADNSPFAGSYVPQKYYEQEHRVESLMLEINRGKYMDEATGEKSKSFEKTQAVVRTLLKRAASSLTNS